MNKNIERTNDLLTTEPSRLSVTETFADDRDITPLSPKESWYIAAIRCMSADQVRSLVLILILEECCSSDDEFSHLVELVWSGSSIAVTESVTK